MADIEVDGIVAIGYFSEKHIESLRSICNNIVFVDSSPDEMSYDSVVLNYELGMRQAMDHLRRLNHTNKGMSAETKSEIAQILFCRFQCEHSSIFQKKSLLFRVCMIFFRGEADSCTGCVIRGEKCLFDKHSLT